MTPWSISVQQLALPPVVLDVPKKKGFNHDLNAMKTCKICGESKKGDRFYHQMRNRRGIEQLYIAAECIPCYREARRLTREKKKLAQN